MRLLAALQTVCFLGVLAAVGVAAAQLQHSQLGLATLAPAFVIVGLMMVLAPLYLLLIWGMAIVMNGPVIIVDDAGLRFRDVVGWIQVPWGAVQHMTTTRNGKGLELVAPGGIYLNEKLMRRSRHRPQLSGLEVQPQHLMTYLEFRRLTAPC
jgi:hypothetical protein